MHFEGKRTNFYNNVRDLCSSLGIKPESLRAAVEVEGYEIDGHEIRLIRLPGMDEQGAIQNKDMKPEFLEMVRDWQSKDKDSDWADFDNEGHGSYGFSDVAICPLWRPKSYATDAGSTDEDDRVERTSEGQMKPETNWDRLVREQREREGLFPGQVENYVHDEYLPDVDLGLPVEPNPFERIALDLAALVADKQRQYGDSAGRTGAILRVLYPDGVPPDAYDRALLVVRVLDKLSRLATNKTDLGGENPWRDIAGYALLAIEKGF